MLKRVLVDDGCCCCGNDTKTTLPHFGMHCYSVFVLVENYGDPIQTRESTEYAEVLIDWMAA